MRDMSAYIHSLRRLKNYKDDISGIYPCHGACPVGFSMVDELIEAAVKVEKGEIIPTESELFGQTVQVYDVGIATFLC